jgi:DNA primase
MKDLNLLIDEIKKIPLDSVIGGVIHLDRKGQYHYGICPFHNDTSEGSFVVTPSRNKWKCFACADSPGGDAIDFISKYYNMSFKESVLKIALDFGIITSSEYDETVIGKGYYYDYEKAESKKKKKTEESVASDFVLNKVYKSFIKHSFLSMEDREHLLVERKLKRSQIKEFITWPNNPKKVCEKIIEDIKEDNLHESCLKLVPGFYYDKEEKIWTFYKYDALAFPIKDFEGNIKRIQIRKKNTETRKYVWFSSSFAKEDNDRYEFGTSAGNLIDVEKPEKFKNSVIAVTEGKFKALKLSSLNLLTLSMQGVSNWRKMVKEIEKINTKRYNKERSQIWLCYDSDIFTNDKIQKSAEKLKKSLEKSGYEVIYILWHPKYGKGIDDVINNGYINKLQKKKAFHD